jgi:hypothetical protein
LETWTLWDLHLQPSTSAVGEDICMRYYDSTNPFYDVSARHRKEFSGVTRYNKVDLDPLEIAEAPAAERLSDIDQLAREALERTLRLEILDRLLGDLPQMEI